MTRVTGATISTTKIIRGGGVEINIIRTKITMKTAGIITQKKTMVAGVRKGIKKVSIKIILTLIIIIGHRITTITIITEEIGKKTKDSKSKEMIIIVQGIQLTSEKPFIKSEYWVMKPY